MPATPADPDQTAVNLPDCMPGYELLSVIGSGGFGTVFKARQLNLDRVVAVKVLREGAAPPALAAKFEAEGTTLGQLRHPNIVQVFDAGRHAGRTFIAMELLEGEDFERRLAWTGPPAERVAWAIAWQAAAGLDHAAAHGVVHRDVKPANLFLLPAPTGIGLPPGVPMVKVMDFGLATTRRATDPAGGPPAGRGDVYGSPAYMAPEQHRGAAAVDHRADIFALGATTFHALTGQPPFSGRTLWKLLEQKLAGPPRPGPRVSRAGADLLAAMMAPDPAARVGTYAELLARISGLMTPRGRTAWQRSRGAVAAAVVVVVAGATAAVAVRGGGDGGGRVQPAAAAPAAYTRSEDDHALFDKESLAGWLPPAAGGVWQTELDEESDRVLVGSGFTRRSHPRAEDYRLTIGLDVHTAAAAEVHFAIPAAAPDAGPRLVLRVSRADGAVLGTRDGDRGPFHPTGNPTPFPPAAWFEGRRPYLEVKVERGGGWWVAVFNGTTVGRVADDGRPKAPELRLFAAGGRARADSVMFVHLRPK